jgi:hypothetical protein
MREINSNFVIAIGAALLLASASSSALAASYPVSGKWTYENAASEGPATTCDADRRIMEFAGQRRFDTGGGVPDYRNVSIQQTEIAEYRIVDEFFTGQIRGRANYTLRLIDPDHIEIEMAGKTIALRRCA